MKKRVVVLGAGFGGLELSAKLSEEFAEEIDVVLIDQSDSFVFGFSKLDVMFGRTVAEAVRHPYKDIVKPGVRFVQTTIRSIDPTLRSVETDAGSFSGDVLVVALGADLDPSATPGLVEVGHEFYTVKGAFALRDVLADFEGGRVIVGVTSTPYKCPPAPSETVLLLHDYLVTRGLRDRSHLSLVSPLPVPIPPSPAASAALLEAFKERDIAWYPGQLIRELDATTKVARFADGSELPFDLFLGIPTHHVPAVVVESGMTVDGWIPVNPLTLETSYPGVFAVGDVTSVGTPKAGVFSERQASVAAEHIISLLREQATSSTYDGYGLCYLEFGRGDVAKVEVTFMSGQSPAGTYQEPSALIAEEKGAYGASRIERWFDRTWANVPEPG